MNGSILTGGRDAKVNILDKQLVVLMCLNMAEGLRDSLSPGVRALSLDEKGKNLLVGTFGSEIYELSIQPSSKMVDQTRPLMQSHFSPKRAVCCSLIKKYSKAARSGGWRCFRTVRNL